MKATILGDTHSRTIWKDITKKEHDSDLFLFIGDYFDSKEGHTPDQQIDNFKDIIEFKKQNMDKVILLTGNHDAHYMKGFNETYSGHQAGRAIDIGEVLKEAIKDNLLQMCYVYDKYVFTHAGVTKTWCKDNDIDVNNLEQSINDKFKYQTYVFKFNMGENFSQTGNDICQTPIWVRPQSLVKDMIDDVICVVGHTTVNNLAIMEKERLIMIDALWDGQYLSIINGIPTKNKL
jgi:hypothetical protein